MAETSTKPYMIRALYEWCCDNGYTPYLAVAVDAHTLVPRQHVKGGEIVLNVSPMATSRLSLGNELVEFQARFSGVAQQISIPIGNISAIYARETGHGMAFDVSRTMAAAEGDESDSAGVEADEDAAGQRDGGDDHPGEDGSEGGGRRSPAPADTGERHASGSTVQSLRGGRRRGPHSVDQDGATSGAGPSRPRAADGRIGAGFADASGGDGREDDAGRKEGAEGDASGGPAAGSRKRAAKGQSSADVIAFAPSGGSAKKKSASSRTPADDDGEGTSPAREGLGEGDEEPPPDDGGGKGGKGGKARLTRVK